MKHCKLVEDLWPLYIDGELSEESAKFVEEHLKHCKRCKEYDKSRPELDFDILTQEDAATSMTSTSAEKFIRKLKQRIQFGFSAVVVILILVALGSWYYADWSAGRDYQRKTKEEQAFFKEQLSVLQQISPAAEDILKKYGVSFSVPQASSNSKKVSVKYALDWGTDSPVEWISTENNHWFDDNMLIDAETGNSLRPDSGVVSSSGESLTGEIEAWVSDSKPNKVLLKTKNLYLFLKPANSFSFNYAYSGEPKKVKIDKKFSFQDVDFVVDALVLGEENFTVKYRQITPASEVGVYQLTFSFDDRLGNTWNSDPESSLAVKNPKEFNFRSIPSPSKSWILRVDHVVQVVPAIETEVNLKEDK